MALGGLHKYYDLLSDNSNARCIEEGYGLKFDPTSISAQITILTVSPNANVLATSQGGSSACLKNVARRFYLDFSS
jgi:hypothetical protein